jgi:hypothetical protein
MTIEHVIISDPYIHEPKGVAAATQDKVYVSDGAGSGGWQKITVPQIDSTGFVYGQLISADGSNGTNWGQAVWKDLVGHPVVRDSGATAPTLSTFRGGAVVEYAFALNDVIGFKFHIPHDYKPGSDLYLHVHWSHNGTAISGNMVWTYYATYAKGHNQAAFSAEVTGTISYATVDIATTPRYRHRIDEIQFSASAPSVSQLDTDLIEPDGLIAVQLIATTIPTISGGSPNEPFILNSDIHYQATYQGTLNKTPNFYA